MGAHLDPKPCQFLFQRIDLFLYHTDIDLLGGFEGVHVAGNIEITIVFDDFSTCHSPAVPLQIPPSAQRLNDPGHMVIEKIVLVLTCLKPARGVDEEDISPVFERPALLPPSVE